MLFTAASAQSTSATTIIDLNDLDAHRHKLDPIDNGLDAPALQLKAADPLKYCLENHPQNLDKCSHSLDNIVLVSGRLRENIDSSHALQDVYLQTITLSEELVATWSLSILAVALTVRLVYELVQLGRGGIQFPSLALDMVFYTCMTGGYVLLVKLIAGFYLDISGYFSSEVLLSKLRDYLGILRADIDNRLDTDFDPINLISINLVETAMTVFTSFFSFFVKIFQYFVLLVHGILFTIIIMAGTIVVPVSVAGYVNLFSGWMRLCATVVLYPIIQAVMFWALLFYFDNSGLLSLDQDAVLVQTFELHFVENLINISVIVIYLIAPFATNIVVTGSGNLASVLTPMYLAGALAAKRTASVMADTASGVSSKMAGGTLSSDSAAKKSDSNSSGGIAGGEDLTGPPSSLTNTDPIARDGSDQAGARASTLSRGNTDHFVAQRTTSASAQMANRVVDAFDPLPPAEPMHASVDVTTPTTLASGADQASVTSSPGATSAMSQKSAEGAMSQTGVTSAMSQKSAGGAMSQTGVESMTGSGSVESSVGTRSRAGQISQASSGLSKSTTTQASPMNTGGGESAMSQSVASSGGGQGSASTTNNDSLAHSFDDIDPPGPATPTASVKPVATSIPASASDLAGATLTIPAASENPSVADSVQEPALDSSSSVSGTDSAGKKSLPDPETPQ